MNNELSQLLITMFKDGKDFVIGQGPDIIQQYLASQLFELNFTLYLSAFLLGLCLGTIIVVAIYGPKSDMYGPNPGKLILLIICGVGAIGFAVCICGTSVAKYKLTHYPKGYLLEQVLCPKHKK
jgi:MFS family permease